LVFLFTNFFNAAANTPPPPPPSFGTRKFPQESEFHVIYVCNPNKSDAFLHYATKHN
jgi:hypothetical protein